MLFQGTNWQLGSASKLSFPLPESVEGRCLTGRAEYRGQRHRSSQGERPSVTGKYTSHISKVLVFPDKASQSPGAAILKGPRNDDIEVTSKRQQKPSLTVFIKIVSAKALK